MVYSRDNVCEIHSVHQVEADNPVDAALKFKEEMCRACDEAYNSNIFPGYINIHEQDYLPEIWTEGLNFYDEDGVMYDSSGHNVPDKNEDELDENGEQKPVFIWGVKAYDDLSQAEVCEFTMNDIDVMYDGKNYILNIEEIYTFDREMDKLAYLSSLADAFKNFLLSKDYTEAELDDLDSCSAFRHFYPSAVMEDIVTWKSPVLSDLYKKFRLFITSFEAVVKILHCDKIDFEKMCE